MDLLREPSSGCSKDIKDGFEFVCFLVICCVFSQEKTTKNTTNNEKSSTKRLTALHIPTWLYYSAKCS